MVPRSFPAVALALAVLFGLAAGPAAAQPAPSVQSGIQYAAPKGKPLMLDVYQPSGAGPFAAVVLVHGGGWEWGDRSNMADVAEYLAEHGFVAFSIDYRLANTHRTYNPYPAAVEDVRAAIRWVRDHAAEYRVDPTRLGLLGSSAGAHLVSLVGMEGSGPLDRGDRVAAVVSWSGPQDMVEMYRDAAPDSRAAVEAFTDCHGGVDACASILKEVSPITYVDRTDPPLFFSNGSMEHVVPIPQANEMDRALTAAGVQHQFVEVPGTLHAQHYTNQTAPSLPAGQTVLQASLAWLQRWLVAVQRSSATPPAIPSGAPTGSKRAKESPAMMIAAFAVAGFVLVGFAAATLARALRRRSRRARREREWKEGQRRTRRPTGGRASSQSRRSRTSSGSST